MRCGLSAQSDGFIECVWFFESEEPAKTLDRPHQNVNAQTENGIASGSRKAELIRRSFSVFPVRD
jgi:hypothetical protein